MSTVPIEDSGLRKSYVGEITKRQKLETMPRDYDVIQTFPFEGGLEIMVAKSNYRPNGEVQLVYPVENSHAEEIVNLVREKLKEHNVVFHANSFEGYTGNDARLVFAAGGLANEKSSLPPKQFVPHDLLVTLAEMQKERGVPITTVSPSSNLDTVDYVSLPTQINKATSHKLHRLANDNSLALGA